MATVKRDPTNPKVQGPRDATSVDGPTSSSSSSAGVDLRKAAEGLVARERNRQGLPPKVSEPSVIGRIVALLQPLVED